MISHKHKFIFVHIPKTAGTSIRESLAFLGDFEYVINGHVVGLTYRFFRPVEYRDYTVFTWTRNTWDRVCSWFHFHKFNKGIRQYQGLSFEEWVLGGCRNTIFDPWWIEWSMWGGNNPLSQLDFVDGVEFDFVGSYENIVEDFDELCCKLGVKVGLLKSNVTEGERKHYSEYYTDEMVDKVGVLFGDEIAHFGYEFGG
jgi:hypothetical protein